MMDQGERRQVAARRVWWLGCLVALAGCPGPEPEPPPQLVADPPQTDGGVPGAGTADYDRGVAYVEKGRCEDALPLFERSLEVRPDNGKARYYLALCHEQLGDLAAAEDGYRKALQLDPNLVEAALNLGALYLDGQASPTGKPRPQKAIEVLSAAVKKMPEEADLHENLAFAYRLAKEFSKAIHHYELALKLDPKPRLHFAYGDLMFEAQRPQEALAHLTKALPGYQDDADTLGTIATLLGHCQAYEQCVAAFDDAIKLKADNPEWYVRRGLCRHELKDEAGARRDYQAALKVDKKYAAAHYYLGMSLLGAKRRVEAANAFRQAIKHGKDGPWAARANERLKQMIKEAPK